MLEVLEVLEALQIGCDTLDVLEVLEVVEVLHLLHLLHELHVCMCVCVCVCVCVCGCACVYFLLKRTTSPAESNKHPPLDPPRSSAASMQISCKIHSIFVIRLVKWARCMHSLC